MREYTRHIISKIKGVATSVLPANTKLLLYGSRARGDNSDASDWDLLIILDKQKATHEDYDRYAFPFYMLGAELQEIFSPIIYGVGQWNQMSLSSFYKNVQSDKIVIL